MTLPDQPIAKPMWFETRVTLGNVLSIIATLGAVVTVYTNLKLDVARASQDISTVQEQVKSLEDDNLPTRLSILENSIIQNRAARDKAQDELVSRLDRLQTDVIGLSNGVAALNATLKATSDRP